MISRLAIYAGSFDPITNGHMDIIGRGAKIFERLIVAVLRNEAKQPLFSVEERVEMIAGAVSGFGNVEVDSFGGLVVEYASASGAGVLLRGVRSVSDYEYEVSMARMNRHLAPELETVCLLANDELAFVSSRMVKEVCGLGGDVSALVPVGAKARLKKRLQSARLVE